MKIWKKFLRNSFFVALVGLCLCGLQSCTEEDGERCQDCTTMKIERAAFRNIVFKVFDVAPDTRSNLAYYNGDYYFTKIFNTDTAYYFVANPEMIPDINNTSSFDFTANVFSTTNVVLSYTYKGNYKYYELKILEMGVENAVNDGNKNPEGGSGGGSKKSTESIKINNQKLKE